MKAIVRGRLDTDALSQLNEIQRSSLNRGIDRRRELDDSFEGVAIREGRQTEDAGIREARGERDINAEAFARLAEIQSQTAELTSLTAITDAENTAAETLTAIMTTATATTESATAQLTSVTAGLFNESTLLQRDAIDIFQSAATTHLEAGDILKEAGRLLDRRRAGIGIA